MLLLTDVHYFADGSARAAGVMLDDWTASTPVEQATVVVESVAPYVSGEFYRRELPCLLRLLESMGLERSGHRVTALVVDGHVWLGDAAGLGAHLHELTRYPVIGIAKNFHASGGAQPVLRGTSRVPLYVSAIAYPIDLACANVVAMAGEHRIPTMLKRVDRLARDGV